MTGPRALSGLLTAVMVATLLVAPGAAAVRRMPSPQRSVVISTKAVPGLGTILVDAKGRTLYMFVPDKRKKVTCVATCAAIWPPVKVPKGAKLVARGKAKRAKLGVDADPAGGQVATYNRWPLYTYVGDRGPRQAKGQALNLNGGLWFVLTPMGRIVRRRP